MIMVMMSSGNGVDGNDEDVDLEWMSAHLIASFLQNILSCRLFEPIKSQLLP